jgi:hypothetical protein
MRLAVSGSHGVGKTTLIEDFVAAHPGYAREEEPYWALAQQGVVFADAGSVARAGGDALHLTLDAHEPLARLVADVVQGTRTPPIA